MPRSASGRGAHFRPGFPPAPRRGVLVESIAAFYGLAESAVDTHFRNYRRLHRRESYRRRFGELKTLNFAEAFVLYVGLARLRPDHLVEIGTQYGQSTRRILDMRDALGLETEITCYDIEDRVAHFSPDEARLHLRDLTGRFRETVLQEIPPAIIYLDAHPRDLLAEVIGTCLEDAPDTVLAIHDCGPGLCNPEMTIARDDPEITSHTGVWERHVLADLLGVADPRSSELDAMETASHRLRVFPTAHGLATLAPLTLVGSRS